MPTEVARQNVRHPRYFVTTRCFSLSQYQTSVSICFIFYSVVVSSNMIAKQLLERCTLWQIHLSKRGPKPSWKLYDTLLLDILKNRHIVLSDNIFLKSNGEWSQYRNVKSSSVTLKPHIASAADTLLCIGESKVNDGQLRKLKKMPFAFYSL